MSEERARPKSNLGRNVFLGFVGLAALTVVVPVGAWFWWDYSAKQAYEAALETQQQAAEEQFAPMMDALEAAAAPEKAYDIDKTIRVIHEIDRAMDREQSLQEYLRWASRQDYSDVAPEVLEARRAMLEPILELYAKQVELDDQQAMWEVTSEFLLATLSVVNVSGEASMINPEASLSVDQEQAKQLFQQLKDDRARHKQLINDIAAIETEMFGQMMDYSEVYYRYIEEWDQLAVLRDRAYLAAYNGDWEAAAASAQLAAQKAPAEREAHLLQAMALIEMDNRENAREIEELLEDYIQEHPDSTAPAFLLLGVHQARSGQTAQAQLSLQQAAAYYPKQADQLTDMLNPYEMRSFLRKSREGQFIVEMYKSTMLGAGYFSPDLQLAKVLFDKGDDEAGRRKVLDHFARRRTQQQWDFVMSDIGFCQDLLGPHFWKIFPEHTYLDLEVGTSMVSSALSLSVNNRSSKVLHNATLVLAVQLTDMYAEDYEAIPAPDTVPAVAALDSTSFGSVTIETEIFGKPKTSADIVRTRAILISDEAVSWVDTDEYRLSEDKTLREKRRAAEKLGDAAPVEHPLAKRHPGFQGTMDKLVKGASDVAQITLEEKYGADNLVVALPKELAILRPMFRLKYGDTLYEAQDNLIDGDQIQLRFAGVQNFDAEGAPPPDDLELLMGSPFGDVVFSWKNNGDLTWRFGGAARE